MRNTHNNLNAKKKEGEIKGKPYHFQVPPETGEHNKRLCLTCGKRFNSKNPHNRICVNCSLNNEAVRAEEYSVSFKSEDVTHMMEENICEFIETRIGGKSP
ncbi:MAG: hypothetical protein MRK02_10795 [Candidatus Scalindua sp.]|nr:hypothetical protein [Candidatus Scalindua sp.]